MDHLHVDFETRSRVDLLKAGAYAYAYHESTEPICMAYAFGDEDVESWVPEQDFPERICQHIEDGGMIYAHNAQFERVIWWNVIERLYEVPHPTMEQFYCTAAQARVSGLPGALAGLSTCLGLKQKKDFKGAQLIRTLCIPHKETNEFFSTPKLIAEMVDYCMQDVRAERELAGMIRKMTPTEFEDYIATEEINERGICVDVDFATAAVGYAKEEKADLVKGIEVATKGVINKASGTRLTRWVYDRLSEEHQTVMHVYKKGELKLTMDSRTRETLMGLQGIRDDVKQAIELSDGAQASSTGKYSAMALAAHPEDWRVRGGAMFCGAAGTGRWSGKLVQFQNFPRDGIGSDEVAEEVRGLIVDNYEPEDICETSGFGMMQTLKRMLRYAVQSDDDMVLVQSDWASIEGRLLPWLADTDASQKKLDEYRAGVDMYIRMAAKIYGIKESEVTKDQRQVGKVAELALGYGGGKGAFQQMAKGYGVFVSDVEAERIKIIWRKANPWAERFWNKLSNAARAAVRRPGQFYKVGRVSYTFKENYLGGTLFCLLPSGRMLSYPQATVKHIINKWGAEDLELTAIKAGLNPKAGETVWPRHRLWRGLLAENVTQAAGACLLRGALKAPSIRDMVIAHVHDEIILEVPVAQANIYKRRLHSVMLNDQEWAEGLPLAADGWVGTHYRK